MSVLTYQYNNKSHKAFMVGNHDILDDVKSHVDESTCFQAINRYSTYLINQITFPICTNSLPPMKDDINKYDIIVVTDCKTFILKPIKTTNEYTPIMNFIKGLDEEINKHDELKELKVSYVEQTQVIFDLICYNTSKTFKITYSDTINKLLRGVKDIEIDCTKTHTNYFTNISNYIIEFGNTKFSVPVQPDARKYMTFQLPVPKLVSGKDLEDIVIRAYSQKLHGSILVHDPSIDIIVDYIKCAYKPYNNVKLVGVAPYLTILAFAVLFTLNKTK